MSHADWLMVSAVVLSMVHAAAQGFAYEMFSLAGTLGGFLAAAWEYQRASAWYAPFVKSAWVAEVAAFLTIFLLVVLLAGILGRILRWGVHGAGLGWSDRALGAAFGLLRGTLMITVVLMALTAFTPGSHVVAQSRLAPYLLVIGRTAVSATPAQLQTRFRQGLGNLRDRQAPGERSPLKKESAGGSHK
jgi:membrane protein required for colicin V production